MLDGKPYDQEQGTLPLPRSFPLLVSCLALALGLAKGLAWALAKGTKDSQGTGPWTTGSSTAGAVF